MVHADASNFAAGISKTAVYEQIYDQANALFEGQRNWVWYVTNLHNLANTASLLYHGFHALPAPSNAVNWAGFYVLDSQKAQQLILGPFMGKVACQTVAFGKGVCGAAAAQGHTVLVEDVEEFPGHIACDEDSKSEIVVPIVVKGEVVAIIDIDCAELRGFDEVDQQALEKLAKLLGEACDWKL